MRYWTARKKLVWLSLAALLLALVVGGVIFLNHPPVYQATSVMMASRETPEDISLGGTPGMSYAASYAAYNLGRALQLAAWIQTRPVMNYVLTVDPTLAHHHYSADDLMADVAPTAGTTSATITLLARAPSPQDAVLIANAVAHGFASYIQMQAQQHLDALRKQLQAEEQALHQQLQWEEQGGVHSTSGVPHSMLSVPTIPELQDEIKTLQAQLSALPPTVNGDVFVVQLATMKDVVQA